MSNEIRTVRFVLAGDGSGAVKAMHEVADSSEQADSKLKRTGHTAKTAFDGIDRGAGRLRDNIKWVAGTAGLGGIAFGIKDAVEAGQRWQQQQAQLRNALRNVHTPARAMGENVERLNRATETASTHGGFTPAEQTQGLAQFVRQTGSATKAIQLNKEATELARGTNMGYSRAVRAISSLQNGQTRGVQRYIGTLIPVTRYTSALTAEERRNNPQLVARARLMDRQASATEANRKVLERFSGSTAAYSRTAAGSISNVHNSFDLISEEMGREFLPYVAAGAQQLTLLGERFLRDWPHIRQEIRPVVDEIEGLARWVENVVRQHPDIVKVAAALAAAELAARGVKFASGITGITRLIGLLRRARRLAGGIKVAEDVAGNLPGGGGKKAAKTAEKDALKGIEKDAVSAGEKAGPFGLAAAPELALPLGIAAIGAAGGYAASRYLPPLIPDPTMGQVNEAVGGRNAAQRRFDAGVGTRSKIPTHVSAAGGTGSGGIPDFLDRPLHFPAASQPIHVHTTIKLDERVLAEAVTHYTLRKGARK